MIEVFKTNVQQTDEARKLINLIMDHFPGCTVNFDLGDCDKILRVKHNGIDTAAVAALLHKLGFTCEELQD